jgi:hypothetical protein
MHRSMPTCPFDYEEGAPRSAGLRWVLPRHPAATAVPPSRPSARDLAGRPSEPRCCAGRRGR